MIHALGSLRLTINENRDERIPVFIYFRLIKILGSVH